MTGSGDTSETRRTFWCPSTCFALFIVISLLTHIAELFLNAVYTWFIYADVGNPVWTATVLGFLLLPLVVTQLFSAILFLGRRDSVHKKKSVLVVALIHVLQVGFIWRHLSILNERDALQRKKLLIDLLLLRLVFAFTSGLPLLSLQTFYIVTSSFYHGIQLAAMIMCLISTSWALASFRRQNETCNVEKVVLTWPGIVFRLLWRIGEITARVVSLALFASAYTYWTFLVLSLHWLTMVICILSSILGTVNKKGLGRGSHVMICVAIGYVYTFTYLNFSQSRSKCRYICYYLITLLETSVLVASWLLHNTSWRENIQSVSLFATVVSAFLLCVVAMVLYYACFHMKLSRLPQGNSEVCVKDECINCKLSLCTKHNQVLQRPFNTGWTSQYQTALYSGHYYRNVLQDSLLDSASELDDRGHQNVSFNDREVEFIMETAESRDNIVDVHSDAQLNREGVLYMEDEQHVESPSHGLGATLSATSTVKSSLDLYNNLDSLQSDKSYSSSSLLKDKAIRDTAAVNNSLLQMDSEFWICDGVSEAGGLAGYNLPVSRIGHDSDVKQTTSRPLTHHKDITDSSRPNETAEVGGLVDSNDVSVEDNREAPEYSPREKTESHISHYPEISPDFDCSLHTSNHFDQHANPRDIGGNLTTYARRLNRTFGKHRETEAKCSKRKHVKPWCPDESSTIESEENSFEPALVSRGATKNVPSEKEPALATISTTPIPIHVSGFPLNNTAPVSLSTNPSPVSVNDSCDPIDDLQLRVNPSHFPVTVSPSAISDPSVVINEDSESDDNPEMII